MWDFAGEGWVHRLVLQKSDPWDEGTESPFLGEEVGSGPGSGLGLGYEEDVYSGHSIGNGEERDEGYGGHADRGGSSSGSGSSGGGIDNVIGNDDDGAKVTPINTHTFNNTYTPYTTQTQTQTLDQIPHRSVRIKLVEVPDPSSQLPHRTRVPPLSSDQTEVEINR